MLTKANVVESAVYLKEKLPFVPEIALVLGSGIGPLADEVENPVYVPYGEIPHFKVSTAPDHAGRMVCGTLAGRRVICMQGRLHGYEGYAPDEVAYPVYVLKELGVKALVVTNASGGINTGYHAGDFMLITDHINMTGKSPLTGKNDPELGTRFPDMTFAYSHKLGEKAMQAAADCGLKLHQGVYCGGDPHVSHARCGCGRHVHRVRGHCSRALRSAARRYCHDHQYGGGRAYAAALGR